MVRDGLMEEARGLHGDCGKMDRHNPKINLFDRSVIYCTCHKGYLVALRDLSGVPENFSLNTHHPRLLFPIKKPFILKEYFVAA